ncbi:hypothetical protein B0H14DRAFT_2577278 [Mycena olivaceomarginata]|nr:hypothetical protein B0H14DRAFT_2577278 [Mycena olivaceomarginata]
MGSSRVFSMRKGLQLRLLREVYAYTWTEFRTWIGSTRRFEYALLVEPKLQQQYSFWLPEPHASSDRSSGGAITIAVLAHISRQLDPNSDVKSGAIITSSFTPSTSSLACNTLWFLSLGLSLSCALIATVVEQWARDFIQRTEIRPSPVIRARIFSYLYFGIQRFGMHTVVEFIPFLLHLSLLFFFGGLVAFLLPIHRVLMVVVAALLCLIFATYIYLTLLPIISSDSPYRTPMTSVAWEILRRASALFHPRKKWSSLDEESSAPDDKHKRLDERIPTMIEVMVHDAVAESSKRHMRDSRAIVWTVRSLTDNNELEYFVDALPDLIWGADGRRRAHDQMISMLLDSHDVQLVPRIEGLLRSCDSGLLHPDLEVWRRVHCIKALWAIAYFLACETSSRCLSASVYWLVRWIGFCSLSFLVKHVLSALEISEPVRDPAILAAVHREAKARGYIGLSVALSKIDDVHHDDIPLLMQQSQHALRSFEHTAFDTVLDYMRSSANMHEMPYEFEATCRIMQSTSPTASSMAKLKLNETLSSVLEGSTAKIRALDWNVSHLDIIVGTILSFLQTTDPDSNDTHVGRAIVKYVAPRKYGEGFGVPCGPGNLTQNTVYSVWVLCLSTPLLATFDEETLGAVSVAPLFPISPCAIAMLKSHIVMDAAELPPDELGSLMNRLQILDSTFDHEERRKQAHFTILIGLLEHTATMIMLEPAVRNRGTATETFQFLARRCTQKSAPQSLQHRFAAWFRNILDGTSWYSDNAIIRAVIDWLYNSTSCEPFDDVGVRKIISDALESYRATLPPEEEVLRSRARNVVFTLNSQLGNPGISAVPQISVA